LRADNFNPINYSKIISMKRFTYMILSVAVASMVACGPSAEEKAATEKAKQDSIAAAQKMVDDSITSANAAAEKAIQDSLAQKAMADSIAASEATIKHKAKPKPKTQEEKKKEETKKATSGRG
jgi:hypothetical protein